MSKIFKSALKIAPIALPFVAPGIGTALGAALGAGAASAPILGNALLGAGLSAAGGGGLKDAALGGLTGGLAGGGGSALARSLGLSGAGASALGGALTGGAAGGLVGGDAKSALLGAGLGGLGGYALSGADVPLLGRASTLGPGGIGPATAGEGFLGSLTQPLNMGGGVSSLVGGGSSPLATAGTIYSGLNTISAQDEIEEALLASQGRAEGVLSPYTQAGAGAIGQLGQNLSQGFNPGDLTQDPGYQFRLQEGEKALDRRLSSMGMSDSGAALKAAQEYGQGLADQTYNDAYNRWLQQNQQLAGVSNTGLGAAGAGATLAQGTGGIRAENILQQNNTINRMLADLLRGQGYSEEGLY